MNYVENSTAYAAEVSKWTDKFVEFMLAYSNAPITILAYYLPHQYAFMSCPLGDDEFKRIGEAMRNNEAMFVAAENSGLMAEAMDAYFSLALDNPDNWHYLWEDINHIVNNQHLRRFVRFEPMYIAQKLLSANDVIDDNDDLWYSYAEQLDQKMCERSLRGFSYN